MKLKFLKKLLPVLITVILVLPLVPVIPVLAATVGPIDPRSVAPGSTDAASGFPAWYRDDNGVAVELFPVNALDNLIGPPTVGNAYEEKLGFNTAFYWNATDDGSVTFPNGGDFKIVFGYEAIFAGLGNGVVGQENVFSRIRLFIKPGGPLRDVTMAGDYLYQHPWGEDTITVTADDIASNRNVRFSDDVGAGIPRNFTSAITPPAARQTTFLRSLSAPPGKLGDGVTAGPVTGGKVRNNVIISGPAGTVTINNFVVAGRLFLGVIPVASFTANPTTGAAPLAVNFTDTSTGPPTSWLWNFGDGTPTAPSTSTLQNPSHTFLAAGTYTVSLTATNSLGSGTTTQVVTVTAPVSGALTANFLDSTSAGPSLTVNFTDTSIGVPTAWSWNFGDGSPPATIQNPSHTYATPGAKTVTLLVTNNSPAPGNAATVSKVITVVAPPPPVPAIPVANFTLSTATGGPPPLAVNFTDTTTGVPTAWSWSFGDGGTSTLQNPSHTFNTAGVFAVTLTASNALGTASVSKVVTVTAAAPPPPVGATAPAAPTGLSATAVSSTQVDLTFTDNANNETLFMVHRATDAAFTANLVELHPAINAAAAPSMVTFSDLSAVAGTTYFYEVLAANAVGTSVASNVVSVTTPAPAPPPPPPAAGGGGGGGGGGGVVSPPPISGTPVTLSGAVASTGGFRVDTNGFVQADAQVKTADDRVVIAIAARTSIADEEGNVISSLNIKENTAPPGAPSGSTVVSAFTIEPSPARLKLSQAVSLKMRFDPAKLPAGASVDRLYIASWDGQAWVKLASTVDKAANTVTAQVTHFSEFAIISEAPASIPTAPAPTATPEPVTIVAPPAPQNLAARTTDSGVLLSWIITPGSNETGFMIVRANDSAFSSGEEEFHVPPQTGEFTDTTAEAGHTYFYKVEAVHALGVSEASNVISVTIPAPPPVTTPPATTTPAVPTTPATTPATTSPVTPSAAGTNWVLIIGIIVAAIILVVLVVSMARRKPAKQ